MKAIYFNEHGGSSHLNYGELPKPAPKNGEALIKVSACALNHLDIWVRRGWPGLHLELPHIGGSDIVGEVVECPENSTFGVGSKVGIYPGFTTREDRWTQANLPSLSPYYRIIGEHVAGGLAEYVCVPSKNLFPLSTKRSQEQVAASILVGLTAWRMLFVQSSLKHEHRVLIVGSGGGVNLASFLIAKAIGAHTTVLAGGEEKCEKIKALGADSVIDYTKTADWHREVLKESKGLGADIVIDNVGEVTFDKSLKAAARGGHILTVGNTSGHNISFDNRLLFTKQLSLIGSTMGSFEDCMQAQTFFDTHNVILPLDTVTELANGIVMLEKLEEGKQFGKIVLKP